MNHVDADLARLHDGLPVDASVHQHLETCARCRELDEAIAFSRRALASLTDAVPREEDRVRMRAAILHARRPSRTRWLAVAAAIALVAAGGWWLLTPHLELVPAPPTARSIEAATRMPAGRHASLDEARRHTGVTPPLRNARILAVATSQAPIATLACEVDGETVVLALARAANLPDAPPSFLRTKHIEVRREGDRRLFTWSASGDAYSLSVPNGVEAAQACALCHAGTRTASFIASHTRGL